MPINTSVKLTAAEQSQPIPAERGLLAAMLLRAISDYVYIGNHELPCHKRTAKIWIMHWDISDMENTPFSFPWICYHLDLDPTLLKDLILTKTRSKNIGDILSFRTRRHKGRNSYK